MFGTAGDSAVAEFASARQRHIVAVVSLVRRCLSAARQAPCRGEDFIAGRKFAHSSQAFGSAFDVGPADDAVAVDQELALELRPLPLQVGLVGLGAGVAVELANRGRRRCRT